MTMRKSFQYFGFILCFLGFTSVATIINVPCTYSAITNALLTTARDGDTVLIAPGSCIISNLISINRGISLTIAGSGTNQTTLLSAGKNMLTISSDSPNVFTIRDLNIVGAAGDSYCIAIGSANFPGPYHVYNIQMTNVVGRGFAFFGSASGCFDHVYGVAAAGFGEMVDFNGLVDAAWTNPIPFGTTSVQCVEDCYFKTTPSVGGVGNGCFDAYDGAQLVFRHNVVDGTMATGGHGYDSGLCSPRSWEVYNNVFTNQTQAWSALNFRGGSGVVFSNKVYGSANGIVSIGYYRSCPTDHNYTTGNMTNGGFSTWLALGQPDQPYYIYFTGNTSDGGGLYEYFSGNPADGTYLRVGFTRYYFTTDFSKLPWGSGNFAGNGGGGVKIGVTLAQTINNLYQAINLVPAGAGIAYSNSYGVPYLSGHDFIATGFTTTSITLINALDNYTNAFGYPAYQQSGTITSHPLTGTNFHQQATLWPCYAWSNTLNGVNSEIVSGGDSCNNLINLIKLNRDYFNDVIPASNIYNPLIYPHQLQALENGVTPPTYTLTVANGSGGGNYQAGSIVPINASNIPNEIFGSWSGSFIANTNSATTTVTMPAFGFTVTAVYIPTPPSNLVISADP